MDMILHAPAISPERKTIVVARHGSTAAAAGEAAQPAVPADLPAPRSPESALPTATVPPPLHPPAPPAPPPQPVKSAREIEAERQQKQLEQAFAEARKKGYEAGFEEGAKEGRSSFVAGLEQLEQVLAQLLEARAAFLAGVEDTAVAIVFETICKILGESLVTSEGVAALVNAAIERVASREPLVVRLHPEDLALIQESSAFGRGQQLNRISWLPDATLATGGCVVVSEVGELDARLLTQLERLLEVLRSARTQIGQEAPVSTGTGQQEDALPAASGMVA